MTTETATGVPTMLGHIALRVRDVDRAVEFYRCGVHVPGAGEEVANPEQLALQKDLDGHELTLKANFSL